jgi:hypothetical protein
MEDKFKEAMHLATELGKIKERNRVLKLLVQYKDAGWVDGATASLLSEDICAEDS